MAVTLIKTSKRKGGRIYLRQRPQPDAGVHILVEGGDESYILNALIRHMAGAASEPQEDVNIYDIDGKPNLRKILRILVKSEGFELVKRIGIILDADESEEDTLKSIQTVLEKEGLPAPVAPNNPVEKDGHPAVTALILPGNGQEGELETLLCESFADKPVDECIKEFFECVERLNGAVKEPEKARVRAYIAAIDPEVATGGAAERGYLNFEHDAFEPIRRFLKLVVWGGEPQHRI